MIENRAKEDRFKKNKDFFKSYHDFVVQNNLVGKDPRIGGDITMFIGDMEMDGKTYLIPMYNPETGVVEGDPMKVTRDGREFTVFKPNRDAIMRAREYIEQGILLPYSSPQEAEDDRQIFYPQITGQK